MLINLFTWCVITWMVLCAGLVFQKFWKRVSGQLEISVDLILVLGICIINVYAEIFSIFYKVGELANVILLVASMIVTYIFRKDFVEIFCQLKNKRWYFYLLATVLLGVMLVIGSTKPSFYDTKLYHGQAIRWIEDYGVVKGLGVLHNRLAYNSAFMCLQALFGYRYIFGVELHSVNAYLAFLLLTWAISTLGMWKKSKLGVSDGFKILVIFYICVMAKSNISSPNTDFFALSLTIYLLAKWFELFENGVREAAPYTQLCFLLVYGVSLKLSVAAVVALAVYPLYLLIKEKKYRLIGYSVLFGIVIISPFLIRNVIISGYLVYPYSQLDLFDVDWKMPASQVTFDKEEVMVWGRKLKDVAKIDWPLKDWFPVWYAELTTLYRGILIITVVSLPIAIVRIGYEILKKKELEKKIFILITYATEILTLWMWFFSSPDIRYGAIFMLLVPITLWGEWIFRAGQEKVVMIAYSIVSLFLFVPLLIYVTDVKKSYIVPIEYKTFKVNECQIDGTTFYYPADHDWTGYYNFPGITYVNRAQLIELRGDSLEDGFRMKDPDIKIDTYGNIIAE